MKIVHIIPSFRFGGIETMIVNIANYQSETNDVYILVLMDQVESSLVERLSSRVHFICTRRKAKSLSIIPLLKFNYWLWKIQPDIIHIHDASLARFIIHKFLDKAILTLHTTFYRKVQHRYCYHKIKKIYAISYAVQKNLLNYLNRQSSVVCDGIDVDKIKKHSVVKLDKKYFSMVQVSRLDHEQKGQHLLIQAISKLKEKKGIPILLDFIGSGRSFDYLKKLAQELNVQNCIRFLGSKTQDYIFDHLCEYDLFVQPSIFEGFGLTVAEAMAAKVPVLVSANEGPLEIINGGKCGYTFQNGNVEDLVNQIRKIIEQGRSSEMIEAAYERVRTYYNVKGTAECYLDEYRKILHD